MWRQGLFRGNWVKKKSLGPTSNMAGVLIERRHLDTDAPRGEMMWRDTWRRWPSLYSGGKPGTDASLTALSRDQPCQLLDCRLLVSRTERQSLGVVLATQSVGLCHGSPRKLLRSPHATFQKAHLLLLSASYNLLPKNPSQLLRVSPALVILPFIKMPVQGYCWVKQSVTESN